jgi:MFS family permease
MLAWRGAAPVYFFDAASFLAVIGALLAMHHRAPAGSGGDVSIGAALDGMRFLFRSRLILWTMLLDFIGTFFAGSLLLMPMYAEQILGAGPRTLGLLYAAQPVGSAVAAAVLSVLPAVRRQGAAILSSVTIYGAAIAAFGVSRSLWLSLLLLAISGAADSVSMVQRQTLRQLHTPDELRGRMTSMNMIFFMGGPQLGEFEAGVVAKLWGVRASVTSGGLLCVLAAAVVALAAPALRRLNAEHRGT